MLTLVKSRQEQETTGFAQFCESQGLSSRTVSAYLSDLRLYAVDESTTPERHRDVAVAVIAESSAPTTIRRRLSALSRFHDFASPGAANPYRTVKRPQPGVVLPVNVADPAESRKIIAYARSLNTATGYRTAAVVALMAGAGLRVSEALDLTFGDFNPHGGSVRVVNGKGRKSRDVPLSGMVSEVVQQYAVNTFAEAPSATDRLFDCTTRTIQRDIAVVSQEATERHLNPHAFRHGFATAVYRSTTDLRLVADLLGHASITTTQIYTHLADDRRAEAVEAAL